MDYSLLQQHTVDLYQLKDKTCKVCKVNARTLLKPQRFDLFAKLYYIDNLASKPSAAMEIYTDHIVAFNPDGREPGREDKNGAEDFVKTFDEIIEQFRENDFDDQVSVVPVDGQGVILDGAHRVAALAYFDKEVTIAQFEDVKAVCDFDYTYFKNRGLPWRECDIVALEMVKRLEDIQAACIWPSNSSDNQQLVLSKLRDMHQIAYVKEIHCDLSSLRGFVKYIYMEQDWTQNPSYVLDKATRVYGKSRLMVVFFESKSDLNTILKEKEQIRNVLGIGKDSLHITDNHAEAIDIATAVLTEEGLAQWMTDGAANKTRKLCSKFQEKWFIFKKVRWIAFKVKVYQLIHKALK